MDTISGNGVGNCSLNGTSQSRITGEEEVSVSQTAANDPK